MHRTVRSTSKKPTVPPSPMRLRSVQARSVVASSAATISTPTMRSICSGLRERPPLGGRCTVPTAWSTVSSDHHRVSYQRWSIHLCRLKSVVRWLQQHHTGNPYRATNPPSSSLTDLHRGPDGTIAQAVHESPFRIAVIVRSVRAGEVGMDRASIPPRGRGLPYCRTASSADDGNQSAPCPPHPGHRGFSSPG